MHLETIKQKGYEYTLCDHGLVSPLMAAKLRKLGWAGEQLDPPSEDQVRICQEWLETMATPRKTVNKWFTSYALKHVIENRCGTRYVSQGAMIEAARRLGYTVQPVDPASTSAFFNMVLPEELTRCV